MASVSSWAWEPDTGCVTAGDDDEHSEELKEKLSLREAYSQLYAVVKLPAMRTFTYVLVACRLGMLPAEQVLHPKPNEVNLDDKPSQLLISPATVFLSQPCANASLLAFTAGKPPSNMPQGLSH